VDQYLAVNPTGDSSLYAAGDIARYPFHLLDGELVRIEHWGMAQIQGAIAAKNMLARVPNYAMTNIPYFWTAQYGKSLKYCGHALRYDKVIMDYSPSPLTSPSTTSSTSDSAPSTPQDYKSIKFVGYYIYNEKVLACCTFNRDPVAAQVVELLNSGTTITASQLQQAIANQGTADAFIKSKIREVGRQ